MDRNMFRRVETCFPVENKKLHDRIMHDLECYLKDDCMAWVLHSDGSYQRIKPAGKAGYHVQAALLQELVR
jgi:polyphosphate kinase